jgi:hypothetical protein
VHNQFPAKLTGVVTEKPAAAGESFLMVGAVIELFDANNNPTGVRLVRVEYAPRPVKEIDRCFDTVACLGLHFPDTFQQIAMLSGKMTFEVAVPPDGTTADTDADGLDAVPAHITELDLAGKAGDLDVRVRLRRGIPSPGEFEESANTTPGRLDAPPFAPQGRLDSFFDIFVEIDLEGNQLHNNEPITVRGVVTRKPAAEGESWRAAPGVNLVDANGKPTGVLAAGLVLIPVQAVPVMRRVAPDLVQICWPATALDHILESTIDLKTWRDAGLPEVVIGDMRCATTPMLDMRRLFRLRKPVVPIPPEE